MGNLLLVMPEETPPKWVLGRRHIGIVPLFVDDLMRENDSELSGLTL